MKYFKYYKGGYIRPIGQLHKWYWFDTDSLKDTNISNTPMVLHLISKGWFTEEMFLDLIEFAKKKFPKIDYTMVIFEGAKKFQHSKLFSDKNYQLYCLEMIDICNGFAKRNEELVNQVKKSKDEKNSI
jgi:hypothetical protein